MVIQSDVAGWSFELTSTPSLLEAIALGRGATELTISRIAGDVTTTIAIEPHRLADSFDLQVERITEASAIAAALDAIVAGEPYLAQWNVDARTELLFSDADGTELLVVYLGRFSWSGQIAGQVCMFQESTLRRWLLERYGEA